jgi:hypothetical protein
LNYTRKLYDHLVAAIFVFCALFIGIVGEGAEPLAIYLTWQHDPTTTMTVQWITPQNCPGDDIIEYQKTSSCSWKRLQGAHETLPGKDAAVLHRVEINNLLPNAEYRFRVSKEGHPHRFKTLPATLKAPLRFVVGGDIYHDTIEDVKETNVQAAKRNPDFALLGGDLAYSAEEAGATPEKGERWLTWLSAWQQTMITPDGRMIPMVTTIGNHETEGRYGQTPDRAAYYYALFPTPCNRGYYTFDVGNYLSIAVLDSGHTHPVPGAQTQWLDAALFERQKTLHLFAIYHVPAYPSVRQMDSKISPLIREFWVPLFEKYNVKAAFEHHDHAYKRTARIKNGKVDPTGVVYIGDGAWGVAEPRHPRKEGDSGDSWYLVKTAAVRHFILVTLDGNKRSFEAISSTGETIDTYEISD